MNRLLRCVAVACCLFLPAFGWAADCRIVSSSCVDATPAKLINGITVTVDQVGGCWDFADQYECIEPNAIDYCAAISKTAGCWQTSTKCVDTAFNGQCITEERTYRCDDPSLPTPSNTVRLDNTYTIVKDVLDTSQCDGDAKNPLCYLAAHTCVEPAETRVINGLPVYKECWKYQDDYSCIDPSPKNDCQDLIDKGCTKVSESCTESTDPIGCVMTQVTYRCVVKKGTETTVQDCSARTSCYDGTCWDTGYPNDTDFAKIVSGLEAARQIGVYGKDSLDLFKGEAETCRKGFGGLKNCCKEDTGAQSNNDIMLTAAGGAAKMGSKYMFDYMYQNLDWMQDGLAALGFDGIDIASKFGSSFELYGLSYTFGSGALAAGQTATGMFGQTIYGLGNGFAFDPYSFAAMVALKIVMELMSCEQEEQQLGMHRGAGLCVNVGEYCSTKVFGVCMETTQAYCCYNSKLARIINEQGKAQIGKGWGTPEAPNCEGFSVAEFGQIDFSAIDMSDFVGDIMNATDLPNVGNVQQTMADKLKNITSNPIGPSGPSK